MNRSLSIKLFPFLKSTALKRGAIFGGILISALLAFEVFNFGTTSFALHDILGDLRFVGLRWSTILAFAFCGIDFAGIARIFTPEKGRDEPVEVWYLFGAWILAAGFNASLTWWGVSVAIMNHNAEGGALVGQANMIKAVPIFVAIMVWMIRILIIGTFSVAGERLFTLAETHERQTYRNEPVRNNVVRQPTPLPRPVNLPAASYARSAPKPVPNRTEGQTPVYNTNRPVYPEPTYHPIGMSAMGHEQNQSSTRR
ncbi:MAG: hypothetical protein HZB19_10775 [Chloroflexi bacterium]|nr:hypothetical protein [Chloroflexota bacterium]